MGFFDFFNSQPEVSEQQVKAKCMQAVNAYQKRDFESAAKLFKEYFDLKGFGKFPHLDAQDYRMTFNLILSQFYSKDYAASASSCRKALILNPNSGDANVFLALSEYKMGNNDAADSHWEKARQLGQQLTKIFDSVADVKMQGFNE